MKKRKKRSGTASKVLISSVVIFFMPLIIAWYLYHNHYNTSTTTNHGHLIVPPIPFQQLIVESSNTLKKNKWQLIYFIHSSCDDQCKTDLNKLRAIQVASGKYKNQINYALLTNQNNSNLMQQQIDIPVLITTSDKLHKMECDDLILSDHSLFLVDPLGNVVLFYPAHIISQNIFKDLQKLLAHRLTAGGT